MHVKIVLSGPTAGRCGELLEKKEKEMSIEEMRELIDLLIFQLGESSKIFDALVDDVFPVVSAHRKNDAEAVISSLMSLSQKFEEAASERLH